MGWRRNGSLGGGSGEECVVTSLVPLGTAVALFERGSNNGLSKELNLAPVNCLLCVTVD